MKRALLAALLALLAIALAFMLARSSPATGPVYTVAQVAARLAHHPRAWYGRTVTVRGTLVLVEWAIQDNVGASLTEQDGCTDARWCTMHVPTDVPVFVFLVAAVPHKGAAAYAGLRLSLQMARNVQPAAPGAPSNLVVRAWPKSARFTDALRPYVPWPILNALAQMPGIGRPLAQSATVQGGAPRLYRVHLWPRPSAPLTTAQSICTPACEDGELLDNLY